MNQEQANLLRRIAEAVRPIEVMNKEIGVYTREDEADPGCMMCEAVRMGVINREDALQGDWDFEGGFSNKFGVTFQDATAVLFHPVIARTPKTTGENYYQAAMQLLTKYGYTQEPSTASFDELMSALKRGDLVPVE